MGSVRSWRRASALALIAGILGVAACGGSESQDSWQIVARRLPVALFSVWGTSDRDVYVVGADGGDGRGPRVEHFDGATWTRLDTGEIGNLWWVFGFSGGPIYMGGEGGTILRYQGGTFTKMATPGIGTVFGIWGATPSDVWAVGGNTGGANGAFAWRLQGDTWVAAPGFPANLAATDAMWKVFGRTANDAWIVGTNGKAVRWDGSALTAQPTGSGESLFTVHADGNGFAAVGGFGSGKILENTATTWRDVSPQGAPPFIGVCLSAQGDYAVGQDGAVFTRSGSQWNAVRTGFTIDEQFHSVWVDPSGGVWVVGGQVLTAPYDAGIVLHQGNLIPEGL